MDSIVVFITGGTFHKVYDGVSQTLDFKESFVEEIVERGRFTLDVKVELLMMKDSLDIVPRDVEAIVDACNKSDVNKIIIVHGTDMMCAHAKIIGGKLKKDKTVVMTGSIVPYKCSGSDAPFNLSCALSFIQMVEPGVYITMNGHCFPHDKVEKDYTTGYFKKIE